MKKNKFQAELKKWRGNRSQPIAANCLDVSLATYRNWEQGRNEPYPIQQSALYSAMHRIDIDNSPSKKNINSTPTKQ